MLWTYFSQLFVWIIILSGSFYFIKRKFSSPVSSFKYKNVVIFTLVGLFVLSQFILFYFFVFFSGNENGFVTILRDGANLKKAVVLGKSLQQNGNGFNAICAVTFEPTQTEKNQLKSAGWSIQRIQSQDEVFKINKFKNVLFFEEGATVVTRSLSDTFDIYKPKSNEILSSLVFDKEKENGGYVENSVSSRVLLFRPSNELYELISSQSGNDLSTALTRIKKSGNTFLSFRNLPIAFQYTEWIADKNPVVHNSAINFGIYVVAFDEIDPENDSSADSTSAYSSQLSNWWKGILGGTKQAVFPLHKSSLSSPYAENIASPLMRNTAQDNWRYEVRPGSYKNTKSKIEIIGRGEEFFPRIISEMKMAKSSVHVVNFGFLYGEMVREIADAMIQVAKKGKSAKIVVSEYGSYVPEECGFESCCSDWWGWMADNGVVITTNDGNPIHNWYDYDGIVGEERWYDPSGDELMQFEHRKLIIIDGRIAWVGGIGFEDHFLDASDFAVRTEGEIVHQIQETFLWTFAKLGGRIRMNYWEIQEFFPPVDEKNIKEEEKTNIQFVCQSKETPLQIKQKYLEIIPQAKKEIIFAMSEFGDWGIYQELCKAVDRGVKITMVVPEHSRSCVKYVQVGMYANLVHCGIDLFEYNPGELHAKLMVIDQEKLFAGSANTNGPGLYYNLEANVFVDDKEKTQKFVKFLKEDTINPLRITKITQEYLDNLSLWERFRNKMLWYADYFLHMEFPCGLISSKACDAFRDDERYKRWKRGELEPILNQTLIQ